MKISLITVVYNGDKFLAECLQSVKMQAHANLEYIIVDGGSTDQTLSIIAKNQEWITKLISEKDHGLYDAINKGINLATGEVVGILNADDMFAGTEVLAEVVQVFEKHRDIDAVYGDLNYIRPTTNKVLREWKSRQASWKDIEKGWMPAHPTLYIRRKLFEQYGNYALDMGTAADYDLIIRFFHKYKLRALYLPILMVNMRMGGLSNKNLGSLLSALKNDYRALLRNKIPHPLLVLIKKKLSKLKQF